MPKTMQRELYCVIDEMSRAYKSLSSSDYMNADYADFAIMALSRFRKVLGNPALSAEELTTMLRKNIALHKKKKGKKECWKGFVADKMARASNVNTRI